MSYVDCLFDRNHDRIHVVERTKEGKRVLQDFPVRYTFYYKDSRGTHKSIFGDPLTKVVCKTTKELRKELAVHKGDTLFESDMNPIFSFLSENYLNAENPDLHICFFDIETDFHQELGYAPTDDPFNKITAITVYLKWLGQAVTLALPPSTLTLEQATDTISDIPNTYLFSDEKDMLTMFLDLIEDADVLSGWNSSVYDIPYVVNRIIKILGKEHTKRLCLWDQTPKKKDFERFGKQVFTYDLVGRVHLDYLELYTKYTAEVKHSYRLDFIGEVEVGENKIPYEGSLDQLYKNDFKKFIEYNIQDTILIDKIDNKLRYITQSNNLAHENTVLIPTTLGSVAAIDQAIVNEAHSLGLVVPNKKHSHGSTQVAGAYVAYPKKGLHKWIGLMDINSLYPSAIRSLNMSPETIVGQIRSTYTADYINAKLLEGKTFAKAWEGLFSTLEYAYVLDKRIDIILTVDWENGEESELSAAELYNVIFESYQPWMISANGTILTYEKEGVIPGLLRKWYADRKIMQGKQNRFIDLSMGIPLPERFQGGLI